MKNEHGLSAPQWAWRQDKISSTEKLVLLALSSHQITLDGLASASKAQLAGRCNLAKRTVDGAIEGLVRAGLIEIFQRPGKDGAAAVYRLKYRGDT